MRTFLFTKRFAACLVVTTLTLPFLPSARGICEAVDLIISHPFPARHVQHRLMLEPLKKELEEKSKGRIKVTIHPGGALAAAPAHYENVVAGAFDIGWTLQGYTPGRFPLTGVVELPFLWSSAQDATGVFWQMFQELPALQNEYRDVKVLAIWTHDLGQLYTTSKPVRTLEDLRGLKIRAAGPVQVSMLRALGAVPVTMPAGEIYDALERGVVDGLVIGLSAIKGFRLDQVVKHATLANSYVAAMIVAMNQQSYKKLSTEDRALLDSLTGKRMAMLGAKNYDNEADDGLQALKKAKASIYQLSPSEMEKWKQATASVSKEWIKEMDSKGLPGKQVYDKMQGLMGKK
ncbi:MAG TPA: TRAP transporter substrate-binding protein [Candidatus Binatia bacterium]|nr:TRAP transporter substrate-binding protein [Candidatus Binatia bacterium]